MKPEVEWRYDRLTRPEVREAVRRDPQPVVVIPWARHSVEGGVRLWQLYSLDVHEFQS